MADTALKLNHNFWSKPINIGMANLARSTISKLIQMQISMRDAALYFK
jgi:hypothetical protein